MAKSGKLKEENEIRRMYFSNNVCDLTSRVLNRNRQDAARVLGVDYGWLRKCCSVGLTRPDRRNESQLRKIADYFRLPVEELWMPNLLIQIWAGGHLPEVREHYISNFHFDEFVKSSSDFQGDVEDAVELEVLPSDKKPLESEGGDDQVSATCDRLRELLQSGRFNYLHRLIDDLYRARNSPEGDAVEK